MAQSVKIMRGEAVAPQQHVGLAGHKPNAGLAECAVGWRKAASGAVERSNVVSVVGVELRGGNIFHATDVEARKIELPIGAIELHEGDVVFQSSGKCDRFAFVLQFA